MKRLFLVLALGMCLTRSASANICILDHLRTSRVEGIVVLETQQELPEEGIIEIKLIRNGKTVAMTRNGKNGRFSIHWAKPGRYELLVNWPRVTFLSTWIDIIKDTNPNKQILAQLGMVGSEGCPNSSVQLVNASAIQKLIKTKLNGHNSTTPR